jgi:hypothetical protein
MKRSGTPPTTRLGDSFEERNSANQMDQRSFATDASQQDEPSLSEQWEDEHTILGAKRPSHLSEHYGQARMNAAAVDRLLPPESNCHTGMQSGLEIPEVGDVSASRSDVVAFAPAPCGKINAGQVALDLCVAATPVYFVAFAILVVLRTGERKANLHTMLNVARLVSPS